MTFDRGDYTIDDYNVEPQVRLNDVRLLLSLVIGNANGRTEMLSPVPQRHASRQDRFRAPFLLTIAFHISCRPSRLCSPCFLCQAAKANSATPKACRDRLFAPGLARAATLHRLIVITVAR